MIRVAVIGGGAAGSMAAFAAAKNGARVTVFEHNEKIGKKLFITGKGRCNLSNDCDTEDFFANVPRNPKFLYSAIYALPPRQLVALFNEYGLATKVERGNRVFPESDKSSDVIKTLEKMMGRMDVRIKLDTDIRSISRAGNMFFLADSNGHNYEFERVIIATGGLSYKATGSTGDGYAFAEKLGHRIEKQSPSLVPLVIRERAVAEALTGLTLKNVTLTVTQDKKDIYSEMGEMLFTHFGISGPLVLSASANLDLTQKAVASIDIKPALTDEMLDARLLRDFDGNGAKELATVAGGLFPGRLTEEVLKAAGVNGRKKISTVTKRDREKLIHATKHFDLTITGAASMNEAVITRGGVAVRDIDPGTMESRRVKGLYFAGEVIDVDAYTGGFNLQIAFSTGYLAGESAASN